MKFQSQIILIILLSFINRFKADAPVLGKDYPGIKCGKDKIKKEKDCTKYGTDSGMLCCYVKFSNNTKICTLLNMDTAKSKDFEIKGSKDFGNEYCCPEPSYKDVKYVHNPIFSYRKEGITREEDMDFEQIMKDLAFQKDKIVKMMQDMYGQIASLDEAKEAYSAFIHYLLAAHEGSVLWHCSMGKDRAGVASILVLKLLDVDEETILEDYLYTNACYGFTEERPTYYFDIVMREYLDSYLEKTGDLDAYIEKEIGITKAEKARFREMYLE